MTKNSRKEREVARLAVDGTVHWSAGGSESVGRLLNLSPRGAALAGFQGGLRLGAPIYITIIAGDTTIESLSAELVHVGNATLGLRFSKLTADQKKQLVDLLSHHR